jgi:hypothetical protein
MHVIGNVIAFNAEAHRIDFLMTRMFEKNAEIVFTDSERSGLLNYLAANPDAGKIIPKASGLRKLRWKARGSGKRSGARVIYYFRDLNMPLLLLEVYRKGECARLSDKHLKQIEKQMKEIVNSFAAARFETAGRQSDRSA